MARVTVEDCLKVIPNIFELVVLTAQRTKDIASGAQLFLERDQDKDPVIALREVASGKLDYAMLKESLIRKYMNLPNIEEEDLPEEEDTLEIQKEMATAFQSSDIKGMSYQEEDSDLE